MAWNEAVNLSIPQLLVALRESDIRDAEQQLALMSMVRAGTAPGFFPEKGNELANQITAPIYKFISRGGSGQKRESVFSRLLKRVQVEAAVKDAIEKAKPSG